MVSKRTILKLLELEPCGDAITWLSAQPNTKQAWKDCPRGDWMLWVLSKLSGRAGSKARKRLVLCACECARLALKYVRKGEERPLKAIETAEAWARNEGPTLKEVHAAADAAYAAADANAADAAAYAAYAAYAADAAAYAAADAAAAAAYAADAADAYAAANAAADAAAADAAGAAVYAAANAAGDAARRKTLKKCAEIVHKHYPKPPRLA